MTEWVLILYMQHLGGKMPSQVQYTIGVFTSRASCESRGSEIVDEIAKRARDIRAYYRCERRGK